MSKEVTKFGKKTKVCSRCKRRKKAELFYDNDAYTDGKKSWCNQCYVDVNKENRHKLAKIHHCIGVNEYRNMMDKVNSIRNRIISAYRTAEVDDGLYILVNAKQSVKDLSGLLDDEIKRLNREIVE